MASSVLFSRTMAVPAGALRYRFAARCLSGKVNAGRWRRDRWRTPPTKSKKPRMTPLEDWTPERITEALKPRKVATKDGERWRAPELTAMKAKKLKHRMLAAGREWSPEWEKQKKLWVMRPPKGHKHERGKQDRIDNILAKLEKQDELVAKHKKDVASRKVKIGLQEELGIKV